jgi:hypothetical protein
MCPVSAHTPAAYGTILTVAVVRSSKNLVSARIARIGAIAGAAWHAIFPDQPMKKLASA